MLILYREELLSFLTPVVLLMLKTKLVYGWCSVQE